MAFPQGFRRATRSSGLTDARRHERARGPTGSTIVLDDAYIHPKAIDRSDGSRDYYIDMLIPGRDGDVPHAYILQLRDRDELALWLHAMLIASKTIQDVPFAGIYRGRRCGAC